MNLDWTTLTRPVLILLAAIIAGSLSVAYSGYRYQDHHRHFLSASAEYDEAFQRYQRAEADSALFKEYRDRFMEYRRRGVIGKENRLSWAEALHKQDLALDLPRFNVSINPRQPAQVDRSPPVTVSWYQSQQTIKAGLLHEGDLFQIFQALDKHADGLYQVEFCHLKKARQIQRIPQAENVQADCTLNWYSMELRELEEAGYAD